MAVTARVSRSTRALACEYAQAAPGQVDVDAGNDAEATPETEGHLTSSDHALTQMRETLRSDKSGALFGP